MGAFGSGVQPSPRLTVDRCPRLNVNTLYATGGLTPGIETRLLWQLTPTSSPLTVLARAETSRLVLLVEGASESVMVQIVRQDRHRGGEQPFLTCPRCGVLRQHLYIRDREVGCRGKGCLSISYRSRHTSIGVVGRVARLRRRLGAAPDVLAKLPPRPRYRKRVYHERLVAELADAERELQALLGATVRSLKRRAKSGGSHHDGASRRRPR